MKKVLLSTTFEFKNKLDRVPDYGIALIESDKEFILAVGFNGLTESWSQGYYSVIKSEEVAREYQKNYLKAVLEFLNFHEGYKIKTA